MRSLCRFGAVGFPSDKKSKMPISVFRCKVHIHLFWGGGGLFGGVFGGRGWERGVCREGGGGIAA